MMQILAAVKLQEIMVTYSHWKVLLLQKNENQTMLNALT